MLVFLSFVGTLFPSSSAFAWEQNPPKGFQVVAKPDGNPCTNDEYDKITGETWYVPIPGCCHVPQGTPPPGTEMKRHENHGSNGEDGDGDGAWGDGYHHTYTWYGKPIDYEGQCDDADPCTVDMCDAETRQCVHVPRDPSSEEGLGECCANDGDCPKEQCLPGVCQKEVNATHGFCVTERIEAEREGGCCLESAECCPFELHDAQSGISLEIGVCDYSCQCVFIPRSECECSTTEDCKGTITGQEWLAAGQCNKLECFGGKCRTYLCDPAFQECDADEDTLNCDEDCDDHDPAVGAPLYCTEDQQICGAFDCNGDVFRTCASDCPEGFSEIPPSDPIYEFIDCATELPANETACSINGELAGDLCIDVPEGLTGLKFCGNNENCDQTIIITVEGLPPVSYFNQNCSCTVRGYCALECPEEDYTVEYEAFDPAVAESCQDLDFDSLDDPLQECDLELTEGCIMQTLCPSEQRITCLIDADNDGFPDCSDCNVFCMPFGETTCPEGYINLFSDSISGDPVPLNETQVLGTCSGMDVDAEEQYVGECDCCDCDEYAFPGSRWTSCQPTRCEAPEPMTPSPTPEPTMQATSEPTPEPTMETTPGPPGEIAHKRWAPHPSPPSDRPPTCDWLGEGALVHDYDCNGETEKVVCCPDQATSVVDDYGRVLYDIATCKRNVDNRCGHCDDSGFLTEGWECEASCDSGDHHGSTGEDEGNQKRRKKECPEPVDGSACQCKCVAQGEWPDVCECGLFIDECVQIGEQAQKRSFFSEGDQCCLVTMQ